MAKFLSLWEMDMTKVPDKSKEQIALYTRLLNMVKEELKNGKIVDWGVSADLLAGYYISEGTEQDIALISLEYSPYVKFKVYPVLTVEQALDIIKKSSKD